MSELAKTKLATLTDSEIATIAHGDETVHAIGDVLRIGSKGKTDFASVKVTAQQFLELNDNGDNGVLGRFRRGIIDHHKGKIEDIIFEFMPNGRPDIGTVKVTVTHRPDLPGSRVAGPDALYGATHSISTAGSKGRADRPILQSEKAHRQPYIFEHP